MRVSFYEILDWEADYLRQKLPGLELNFFATPFSAENLPDADADILSTFVGCAVTADILRNCTKLKFIATRTTGYDHLDMKALATAGIKASNVPAYGDNTVAEFAFALILSLSRKIYPAIKRIREENWFSFEGLRGFDLKGKTLGVVGTGRIGACSIKIAKGFGMEVLAYDPFPNEKLTEEYNIKYAGLEEVLRGSDIITLHVPYMPATHHLINMENIKFCKKGCLFINTSRGALVDTAALIWALNKGIISGAGLDVLEEENFVKEELHLLSQGHPNVEQLKIALEDHELMHMENVLITPHNAFNTIEALKRILDTTAENILAFARGEPINLIKV